MFFTFIKLYKWFQIAQRITNTKNELMKTIAPFLIARKTFTCAEHVYNFLIVIKKRFFEALQYTKKSRVQLLLHSVSFMGHMETTGLVLVYTSNIKNSYGFVLCNFLPFSFENTVKITTNLWYIITSGFL